MACSVALRLFFISMASLVSSVAGSEMSGKQVCDDIDASSALQVHASADRSDKPVTVSTIDKASDPQHCSSCACTFMGRDGMPTNCNIEINSRSMVEKWMPDDATVLEVGARYGSVSCAIAKKLKQSGRQVSVDADHRVWDALEKNKISHGCKFITAQGLLTKHDDTVIVENGFGTFAASPKDFSKSEYAKGNKQTIFAKSTRRTVPHFTLDQIQQKYAMTFDAANFDCEGCAAYVFKDFPELKTQLKLLILESHDEKEQALVNELISSGWVLKDSFNRQRVLHNLGRPSLEDFMKGPR